MTTATIGTTGALDNALRRAFSDASIRLQPDCRMTDVCAALQTMGVIAELQDNVLVLRQDTTELHTTKALRSFAAMPQHERFIVKQGQHPSTWTRQQKVEYLKTHSDDDYRRLIQSPVLQSGVRTLDANMSREDYEQLTRAEKVAFVREFGPEGISRVMSKPRKAK